jgi:hypothetical protein
LSSFLPSALNINLNKILDSHEIYSFILSFAMASTVLSHGNHTFKANGINFSYTVSGTGPLIAQSVGWGAASACLRSGLNP